MICRTSWIGLRQVLAAVAIACAAISANAQLCPQTAPSIVSPAGSTLDGTQPVVFAWTKVADASGYDVIVSADGGATFNVRASVDGSASTASATLQPGTYSWVVRANFPPPCQSQLSKPAAFIVAAAQCPTGQANLKQPANNASLTVPVTFDWDDVAGASGYSLLVLPPAATTPNIVGNTAASKFLTSSLPQGTSQWWVRTYFPNCPATDSAHFTITVSGSGACPQTTATLVSPPDGSSNVKNPVVFDWNDVQGAIGYRLYASFNGSTIAPIATTSDSEFATTIPNGSVEWYVETSFANCPATSSPHSHFTTAGSAGCPDNPAAPQITGPADGATGLTSPVAFQWTAVPGATFYKVVATPSSGAPFTVGSTTATQFAAPLPQGTFTWIVVASFGDGCAQSVSKRATLTVAGGTSCKNSPATLVSPPNGATNAKSPADFQWSAVPGATLYNLYVSVGGGSFELLGTTTDTDLSKIVPAGTISWYVETQFQGCATQRSATFTFAVPQPSTCAGGTIVLSTPANGAAATSPVTFSWSAVSGATAYRLWISIDSGAPTIATKVTSPSATIPVSSGAVEWVVEALFDKCPSVLSPKGNFTVAKKTNCNSNQPPSLVSPVGVNGQPASSSQNVTFKWSNVSASIGYRVWIAAAGQPLGDVGATTDTQLTRTLDPATYTWFVEALFDSCPSVPSAKATVTVESPTPRCTNDSTVLISPVDGATKVSSPVTFAWSSVADTDKYRVYATIEGSNSDPLLIGVVDDTSLTRPMPPGTIRWRVEATFPGCASTRSSWAKFTVPKSANCGSDVAQPVTPADGSSNPAQPVHFDWSDVNGAAGYVLYVKANDGTATPIAETTDSQFTRHTPEGKIEWWVVTFGSGCGALESKHFTFTVPTSDCVKTRPIALTPHDGDQLVSPVTFSWTPVPKAKTYKVWTVDTAGGSLLATTTSTEATVNVPSGTIAWLVEAVFDSCPSTRSPVSTLRVLRAASACTTPARPLATVVGQVASGSTYRVRWTPIPNVDHYELQESTTLDFSGATTQVVNQTKAAFTHTAATAPVQYLYRVRAINSCADERGRYSLVIGVFVQPPRPTGQKHATAEVGTESTVVQTLALPGSPTPVTFSAKPDKPWLTVTPTSGTIPPQGITLTLTADPSVLALGTNTGTVQITYGTSGPARTLATPTSLPVSVSLVTAVAPVGKNSPPPDSLIVPVVAHTAGLNDSQFESDVRVTNTSAQTMKYQVNFTPTASDGTQSGSSTTIQIDSGATMALDDILASFYGAASSNASGVLEIRPTTSTAAASAFSPVTTTNLGAQLTTVASSRTYNVTSNGTFGQFIPAIPFSQFIGQSTANQPSVLSLQQIAQSSAFRTNFGLVEGSGQPANVLLTVFDNDGNKVGQIPQSLLPFEHLQINQILAANNISLTDGRIEVAVTSPTGKVTAYASTVDNATNDPLLVSPVLKSSVSSSRYVIPGVADLNTGIASWRSDIRLFNSGTSPVTATLTYSAQTGSPGASGPATVTIAPGAVKAVNNLLQSLFNVTNSGGSLVVTTPAATTLVATARTYNQTSNGTYGQFIPGVTPGDAVGHGDRALQILQCEQSSRMRTNIGVAETTGNAATVEMSVVLPDSTVTPRVQIPLAANEFRQISLASFGLSDVYNARVTVKVIDGTGKVTAYGSVIDQITQDPSYVPAQ